MTLLQDDFHTMRLELSSAPLVPFANENNIPSVPQQALNGTGVSSYFGEGGSLGFTGMTTQEEYGGAGLGYLEFCYFLEELSKSSVPYAVTVSVSSMVQNIPLAVGLAWKTGPHL